MNYASTLRIPLVLAIAALAACGAHAAQKTTSKCSVNGPGGTLVTTSAEAGGLYLSDIAMTLKNSTAAAKNAYVTFSADAGIDSSAEMRLLFSLDGGAPAYLGPQNLANHTEYYQTRTTVAVISVPPGSHTITPFFFVSGTPGHSGWVDDRCMIVTF